MHTLHFLNVLQGDCAVLQHGSGRVTVIDVCNAKEDDQYSSVAPVDFSLLAADAAPMGNFQQKKHPVNPISYLREHGITSVFRYIQTHPDMDHMDGIEAFFRAFNPLNFWDTDNEEEKDFSTASGYLESDWKFYTKLRDGQGDSAPRRLALHPGAAGSYWNEPGGGDGLYVLAPTRDLVRQANLSGEYNDASYVLLWILPSGHRVVFAGDSHDKTWSYILEHHESDVTGVDLLTAPHHGRYSGRSYEFLDVLRPKLTLFGNARHEYLAYGAWSSRELPMITNNQANCVVVDLGYSGYTAYLNLYVTNESFARAANAETFFSPALKAWYLGPISDRQL